MTVPVIAVVSAITMCAIKQSTVSFAHFLSILPQPLDPCNVLDCGPDKFCEVVSGQAKCRKNPNIPKRRKFPSESKLIADNEIVRSLLYILTCENCQVWICFHLLHTLIIVIITSASNPEPDKKANPCKKNSCEKNERCIPTNNNTGYKCEDSKCDQVWILLFHFYRHTSLSVHSCTLHSNLYVCSFSSREISQHSQI